MIKNLTIIVHQKVLLFYESGLEVSTLKDCIIIILLLFIHLKNCNATGGYNNYIYFHCGRNGRPLE
jgi:hypothetical protein